MSERNWKPPAVDLDDWKRLSAAERNGRLFDWLCDDERRAELYAAVRRHQTTPGRLAFPSRSIADDEDNRLRPRPAHDAVPPSGHQTVHLVVERQRILEVLENARNRFSNAPYAALGTGTFMLSLDRPEPGTSPDLHARQVAAAMAAFPREPRAIQGLCDLAVESAGVLSLAASRIDAASFAEQAALRFCGALFGFALRDHPLLESSMRATYRAMSYRMFARHFVSDPTALPLARQAMAQLLTRSAELIDEFRRRDPERPKGLEPPSDHPAAIEPVMKRLALMHDDHELNGEELAVLVVGSMAGIVGNVQASVCIALNEFFGDAQVLRASALSAHQMGPGGTTEDEALAGAARERLERLIAEAHRLHPPAPFLPRVVVAEAPWADWPEVQAGDELILALGGATREAGERFRGPNPPAEDPLIFGALPDARHGGGGLHHCIGHHLARPLVTTIVQRLLRLPGLAEQLDPEDAEPLGLTKTWGFRCDPYRLTWQRDQERVQQSLNVSMRIRAPVHENAAKLRATITAAAPRIERALRDSRHVHFAWFELIDADTRLVLHTVYDGNFDAYIQHFVLKVGDLFDSLFQYLEDAPPMPVDRYPLEFIETIRRFDQKPAAGYFFSAYPGTDAARITRDARARASRQRADDQP